jgi:hypothetical protein
VLVAALPADEIPSLRLLRPAGRVIGACENARWMERHPEVARHYCGISWTQNPQRI